MIPALPFSTKELHQAKASQVTNFRFLKRPYLEPRPWLTLCFLSSRLDIHLRKQYLLLRACREAGHPGGLDGEGGRDLQRPQ